LGLGFVYCLGDETRTLSRRILRMKKYAVALCALAALLSLPLLAADVDGTWTRKASGGTEKLVLKSSTDGKLTGTFHPAAGKAVEITDGSVKGADVTFKVNSTYGDNGSLTQTYKGTVSPTDLTLTVESDARAGGKKVYVPVGERAFVRENAVKVKDSAVKSKATKAK
jgi:hypothetical protein